MNGTTNTDRTVYFETMPKNQLDLACSSSPTACALSPSPRRTSRTSARR